MINFLVFFIGVFLGLTIFAIFGANKDLVATEIDRDLYKKAYEEQREALHTEKENAKAWEIEAKKWANELGEQKIERGRNEVNRCVMCGEAIPEGSQVCWKCNTRLENVIIANIGTQADA